MMYPLSANVSMCTTWMLPFSVPTYSHLLATGRCKHVILQGEKRKEGIDFYTHVAFIKNIKYAHPAAPPGHPLSTVITEQSQSTQLVQWHSSSFPCEHGTLLYSSTAAPTEPSLQTSTHEDVEMAPNVLVGQAVLLCRIHYSSFPTRHPTDARMH